MLSRVGNSLGAATAMVLRGLVRTWLALVMAVTGILPDVWVVLKLRGFLVRWCFHSCGRNFQVAKRAEIIFATRMNVGNDVYIAYGCWLQGVAGITLGDEVMLGPYTVLATNNHSKQNGSYRFGSGSSAPIKLGRGVWTGAHVVVTAGVTIGAGGAVAAGAVVTGNVADHTIVGGVPARVIATDAIKPE